MPKGENWISYPLTIGATGHAIIQVDQDQTVRILALDTLGAPVPELRFSLLAKGGESIVLTTDIEGRGEVVVQPGETYHLHMSVAMWGTIDQKRILVKARREPYELKLARQRYAKCILSGLDGEQPALSLTACFGPSSPGPLFVDVLGARGSININDAASVAVLIVPGYLPAESRIGTTPETFGAPMHFAVKRGPTVTVARSALPGDYTAPLTATAIPIHICESLLRAHGKGWDILNVFSSEFALKDGDLILGPFTPGIYALKVLDAAGKTLWEEERDVK
jgi:hypothetical protein